jgi:hypothetical protein
MQKPNIIETIQGLTDRIIAKRVMLQKGLIVVGRLDEKLKNAAGVVSRISSKIEARADNLIAREQALEMKTEQAFAPHEGMLDEAEKGLEDVEKQLSLLTNGGPGVPLEESKPTTEPVAHHPPGLTRGGIDFNK